MPPTGRMRHLTTVRGAFHGRLLAARLGAAGVLAELRGSIDGPYPFEGPVDVYVSAEDLEAAREMLLGDAVDEAVDDEVIEAEFAHGLEEDDSLEPGPIERRLIAHQRRMDRIGTVVALMLVVALIVVGLAVTAH